MRELKHGGIAVACGVIVVLSFLMLFLCSAWLLWSVPVAQMLALTALSACGSGVAALMGPAGVFDGNSEFASTVHRGRFRRKSRAP